MEGIQPYARQVPVLDTAPEVLELVFSVRLWHWAGQSWQPVAWELQGGDVDGVQNWLAAYSEGWEVAEVSLVTVDGHLRLWGLDPTREEAPAYGSSLTLWQDDLPAIPSRPIMPTAGPESNQIDPLLALLKRAVVDPVVTSLLRPDELEAVGVHWAAGGDPRATFVRIVARGQEFQAPLTSPEWSTSSLDECALALAGQLEDWIAESSFGWGENRRADYTLPRL